MTKPILVAVDGSAPSKRAVEVAVNIAKGTGQKIAFVSVIDLRQIDIYEGFYLTEQQLAELEKHHRETILDGALKNVPKELVHENTRLLRGPVLKALLDEAEKASMVVVGRTGKGALDRLLEGSVSRGLSIHSTVPVVVVP
jgi:nucleotide-binding universal stress UspA family protein